MLSTNWLPEYSVMIMSYVLAFIMIAGIIMLAGWIIHKMISVTPLSILNHLAGALLGLVMTLLLISLTLNIVERFDRQSSFISPKTKMESQFYFYFKDLVPTLYPIDLFIWNEEEAEE
jgi:membrane protein required for colicin V production